MCRGVQRLGVDIDQERNEHAPAHNATLISSLTSSTQIWVVPTDGELVILLEVLAPM